MSADDFQTKYASVMESMLKSAVAETTKLFETMVDELKAEISKIKKENEDLKTRCSRFENARSHATADARDSEPGPGRRDTAVQCDLVPLRTMLVEQCELLRHSLQNQEQQCGYEAMEYALQETHGEGNSQMAFILVKQQGEVERTVVCGQVMSDKAGPPRASACRIENEGPFSNQECSTGEIPLPQKDVETQVALQLPCLVMDSGLQGAQNQSPELEHSLVISLAAIKDDMEEESEVGQKISEIGTQGEFKTSEKHPVVVAHHQSEVEPLENEQPSVVPQQCQREGGQSADVQSTEEQLAQPTPHNKGEACDELKNGVAEGEASSLPDLLVRRRRGRPPKKAKHLQRSVKEMRQSPSSDIPTEQEVKNPPTARVEMVEVSDSVGTVNITSSESRQASPVQLKESSTTITLSVQERTNTVLGDVDNGRVGSLAVSVASLSRRCPSLEILNTPQAESVQPRERRTSVTLQDAMLLVEAMNQSTAENTFSSPRRMAAPPQTQCAPRGGTLQTVDEVPSEPQTPPLPVETPEAAGKLPGTELSTTQLTIEKLGVAPQTSDATPTNEALARIKVVTPKQQHTVPLSNTTTSSSTAATQTSVQSLQRHPAHPQKSSVAPSKPGNAVPHKIIVVSRSVSSLMSHKIAAQSPAQLSTVVSTAVAAQNDTILPGSTAAGLPLGKPSFSSVPQKTIYVTSRKSLPVVTSQLTGTSTDPQSGTLPHPKITIIIPRQVSAVASRKRQPQTIVLTSKQESANSAAPVTSSQLISSSQELSVSVDTQTTLDEVATILSQREVNASGNLESPKQTACVSETINAPTETCSNMSVGLVPTSMSPVVPPTFDQSAVVRLTRLSFPFPSSKISALVSKRPTNVSSETESILKEDTTNEKPSVVISTQPSETLVLSTDICPNLKETSIAVSVNTSHMSEEPNDIQEKASLSSENCTTLEESPNSKYVQPSTPSKVSALVFEESTIAINRTEPSAVSGTAGELASNLDKAIIGTAVQQCALPNDPPIEEKQSAALIHLTSITPKDISDPHLQMTKAQFLAKLAVSPVVQDPKKASSTDSVDARASCAETSTSDKKKSLMAQLRSHLKTHFQARRTETSPEPCTETESYTESPKKPRLENDSQNHKNTPGEPIPVSPKNPRAVEDRTSLKETTDDPTPISPTTSGLCKDGVRPKRTVSEPTYVSPRRSKANSESTPLSPRRSSSGSDERGSKNKKSTSMSTRRSSSIKESASPKKTKNTSVRPRRTRDGVSPKNTKTGGSPNNTKTIYVRPKRTTSSRDGASPKKTQCTSVSPRTSCFSKNGTSPKMSTNESTSFSRRSCTLSKDDSSTAQIKRESTSFSPRRCSITTDGASTKNNRSETSSLSVRWPKLAKDGLSPRRTGESTPAKKPRLIQDGTSPKKNLRVVNAKKLAKAAKAKTIAKIKKSNQSKLQNGAKTSQLAENHASCETVRKCTTVWTPPRMSASKTPPAGGKRSSLLPLKKETRSPRSQNHVVIYPPSVSLHPIPVKAPPIVSPLQPLSVIGRRLLKNQCGECGRVLSSSAALESHVSLHTGRRPFSCTLCGKRFPDSKGLKRHGRVHRNGRIHICQQCGKGFVYRFGLTKHLQMVHGRIKPFVCQICNKGFFTKRDVEAHIRIHTGEKPFHCNLCEKQFARRVELNVHLRWHNGEKRHWCPYCGKGFLDFNNLKRHKYIHTGEKPHSCPHCPKNFTQSGHLKKHVKNVHKIQ